MKSAASSRWEVGVAWGSAAQSPAKARVLTALLHQPGDQIDVSNPDQPFTR